MTLAKLAADSVNSSKIVDGTIVVGDIADGAVTSAKILDGTIAAGDIASDAVTTAKILDSNVTYAKIQNVSATSRILGRATVGAGVIEEITLGTGLSLTGTTLNVTGGAPTGAAGGSLTGTYPDPTIATGAVTSTMILDGTIAAGDIASDAVTTAKILDSNVTSAKIADGTVATADLANSNVTYAKLQNVSATNRLLGRATAGAGVIEEITLGTGLSYTGTTLNVTGAAPTGSAGGSLTGTYPNPTFASDSVGASQIAADAVGASELADNAVDTNAIAANAVTAAKLATAVSDGLWTASSGNVYRSSGMVGIGVVPSTDTLEVNGTIKAIAFISTSDARLKENVKTIKGLEVIEKLRGVRFDWIESKQSEIGFIAQEVEAVLPELVVTDPETGLKAVKYSNLVSPVIESVKELAVMSRATEAQLKELRSIVANHSKKLQEHDRRIASLEERVKSLEEMNKQLLNELKNKSNK